MCGIAGTYGILPEGSLTNRLLATMRRRGPDDTGIYIGEDCCLLHARLAIIDPQRGKQPIF